MRTTTIAKKIILSFSILLLSSQSFAYLSLLSTGDILPENKFQLLGYAEGVLDKGYNGININARGSYGLSEDFQVDGELGVGKFDVTLGAFIKWVPIPDIEGQPAVGVRGGVSYFKWNDFSQTSLVAMPFVSKAFTVNFGRLSPYAGLPLGVNTYNSHSDFFTRLALGSELSQTEWENIRFIAEAGFELSKSFSSITVGASYDF